jgi:hypothetical protein
MKCRRKTAFKLLFHILPTDLRVTICMRGCITVLAMIVLLTPHLFQGGYWCLRNLRGIFGPFGYASPSPSAQESCI